MTKRDLIDEIVRLYPAYSRRDAEVIVNSVFESMTEALCKGDRIEIRGFGSFVVKQRQAREGRNPKTGDLVAVASKRVPFFKVGKELKQRVDDGYENEQNELAASAPEAGLSSVRS
ncbi:MAG TPA: integration host factor subunit beta [Candidatus Limnocylindrales bacterium]|nr:integration host factor subunit beta [Candidatus Limnocylindrales bacterium]